MHKMDSEGDEGEQITCLSSIISYSKNGGALVMVIDFSKAFDRCHIPTLFQKLSTKRVGGKMLKLIKDMYTNAEARLYINNTLGEPFGVTRGVAQGCVLSPTFFAVYMDDLLTEFKRAGLGVPVGKWTQGACSFADDLALVAPNERTGEKYLSILGRWCQRNKFEINVKKSGILRIGNKRNEPVPNFKVNGKRHPPPGGERP